jgi:hypothetical protein
MVSQPTQAQRNFLAFSQKLPELLSTHQGKYALLHDGEIVDFFDSLSDAVRFGRVRFGSIEAFSIQQVTSTNVNLGYYAHAVHHVSN